MGPLERIGVELPLAQAGMGGGLATEALAAAVSEAGALGTIGLLEPERLEAALASARALTAKPLAVNLIVPLTRRAHWRAAAAADVVVTHWDAHPRRRTPGVWIHTAGSEADARRAVAAGADAVIAQGVEAGGHVRGRIAGLDLLARLRRALPAGFPLLLAGGIADRADVTAALEAGAVAAVAGTRFLASEESGAHAGYKQRLVEGRETLLTELFGMGWSRAPHRVLPNAATARWIGDDPRGPAPVRTLHTLLSPLARSLPPDLQQRLTARARASALDLAPAAPTAGMPAATLETHPLYAGATVARIDSIEPAGELVRALTP